MVKNYVSFCGQHNLTPFPVTEASMLLFLAEKSASVKVETLSLYLSALRDAHINRGLKWPGRSEWPRLQKLMEGVKRTSNRKPAAKRDPLTTEVLAKLKPHLNFGSATDKVWWAAACLATYGLLRGGEFLKKQSALQPPLLRSDL